MFRDQSLSDADLIAFSRRFGDLDHAPVQENGQRIANGMPEIYVVSNVIENGVAIGSLGNGEAVWHTDMSYLPAPPKASMLFALEIPPAGGDTWFCDMYAAFERLPPELRQRALGLGSSTTAPTTAAAMSGRASLRATIRAGHPARCIRWFAPIPKAGAACCILDGGAWPGSRGSTCRRPKRFWTKSGHGPQPRRSSFGHRWRVGDLVVWDN